MKAEGRGKREVGRAVERQDLRARTQAFAIQIVKFVDGLNRDAASAHFGKQLLRSATSVAANYRAACRGRSDQELYAKLCICEEEADECLFWQEMLAACRGEHSAGSLTKEAAELLAMFVASKKTLRGRIAGVREDIVDYTARCPADIDLTLDP